MIEKNIWNRVEEYSKEQEGNTCSMVLYGSHLPVFPVLSKDTENVDALIICTPEYLEHVKKELGVHVGRKVDERGTTKNPSSPPIQL